MDEQGWTTVVAAATRAPSIHNTQPWRFTASGDRLDLHRDRDRALPVLDPTGRQQVISCGVAAEFAAVALLAGGEPNDFAGDGRTGTCAPSATAAHSYSPWA